MRVTLVRAALTAVLLSAISVTTAPAVAGGPTSVLLSVPGAGSTSSLYYTDPEYDELAGLVGVAEPGGTFADKASGGGHEFGPGVTVTWLIHDVEPWRVDRVYLGGKDGPWIATQVSNGTGSLWESPVVWHQPANGARLADLLDRLGLGTEASKDTGFEGVAGAPVPQNPSSATQPSAAEPEPASAGSAWLASAGWALGGLVGGVLLTVAWTRLRRRIVTDVDEADSSLPGTDGYVEVLAR